jgi:hypothetical protein
MKNEILLGVVFLGLAGLFILGYEGIDESPVTGRAVSVCSKGNNCDGRTPGDGFTCNVAKEYDPQGDFMCVCNKDCRIEVSLVCSLGNACDGRSPGSIFRCDEEKNYDNVGDFYCTCNAKCEIQAAAK